MSSSIFFMIALLKEWMYIMFAQFTPKKEVKRPVIGV